MLSRCIGRLWVNGVSCGGLRYGVGTRPSLRDQHSKPRQERCRRSGDGFEGLRLPGPAVEDSLPAWLGESHAVPGCVVGRDRVGKRADQGTGGSVARKLSGWLAMSQGRRDRGRVSPGRTPGGDHQEQLLPSVRCVHTGSPDPLVSGCARRLAQRAFCRPTTLFKPEGVLDRQDSLRVVQAEFLGSMERPVRVT
jgi:hypothetical protein